MTREEAIKKLRQMTLPEETRKILVALAPELAESEDDRNWKSIEKAIRGFITSPIDADELLAWLEKKKEQKPVQTEEEREYVRVIKSLISDFIRENYKTTDISFYQKIYDWLDGRHIEQHPSSKFHSGDWLVYDGPLGYAIMQIEDVIDGRYTFVDNESTLLVEDSDKFLRPLTPKDVEMKEEWSDTDNIGWDEAFACVTRAEKSAKNEEELQNAVTAEKWLKEIKFKYYVHPVKQEWREEDEETIGTLINYFEGDALDYSTDEIIRRIKALRPSWKPSKEQMEVLLSTQDMVRSSGYRQNAKVLASLYEQLKKL